MSETFDPNVWKTWDAKSQEAAFAELQQALEGTRQVFYCAKPGRTCNGEPHEGYPYPHARADQWPPPGTDWFVWFLRGGRGSGKTRTGAEYTRKMSEHIPLMRIIAPTHDDARFTCIEGESGLIAACERAQIGYEWSPANHMFTFANGAQCRTFSGEEPDRLRGKQSGFDWWDEPAHMDLIEECWAQGMFGLRLGKRIHILATSTPKPSKWVKKLIAEEDTVSVIAPTSANLKNLAPTYRKKVIDPLVGTRLGRQELLGEILPDTEGALWIESVIQRIEWTDIDFDAVVVGIDPAGTANAKSDETGIIVCARKDETYFVLEDATARYSPEAWAERSAMMYDKHRADALIPEKTYGQDMVLSTLKNTGRQALRIIPVDSRRGKALRAQPIVGMYEQGKVVHMAAPGTSLETLEIEMLEWVPGKGASPNRVDALVHALTHLADISPPADIAVPDENLLTGEQVPYDLMPRLAAWSGIHTLPTGLALP